MRLNAGEIAKTFDAAPLGDVDAFADSVDDIKNPKENSLCFINNNSYLKYLEGSKASIILIDEAIDYKNTLVENFVSRNGASVIILKNAYLAFVKMMYRFLDEGEEKKVSEPQIHETCTVYPGAFISKGVSVAKNTVIYPGVVIMDSVKIGENCTIYPNVSIYSGSVIANRVTIGAGAVIGSDGFGFVKDSDGKLLKVPHIGGVIIGDDVEIGSNTSIDRGTVGNTIIKKGCKIDNLVQIAHNCELGENNILCGMVGLSGSTVLGDNVIMGANSGTKGHIRIADNCIVTARTSVSKDLPPGSQVKGIYPARPLTEELKVQTLVGKLPEIYERIKKLEKERK